MFGITQGLIQQIADLGPPNDDLLVASVGQMEPA
jgi:hypothetical protein